MPMLVIPKQKYVELFNQIHNNKYDYTESEFKTQKDVFTYICPIHDKVTQTIPLHKKYGCSYCFKDSLLKEKEKQFIERAIKKFGDKFKYIEFKSYHETAIVNCPEHRKF